MNTAVIVWVLVFQFYGTTYATPAVVIDNIASQSDCQFLAHQMRSMGHKSDFRCLQVRKIKP